MINGQTHSLGLNREREDIRQASRLALLTVQASRVLYCVLTCKWLIYNLVDCENLQFSVKSDMFLPTHDLWS